MLSAATPDDTTSAGEESAGVLFVSLSVGVPGTTRASAFSAPVAALSSRERLEGWMLKAGTLLAIGANARGMFMSLSLCPKSC